ncbi:MAG: efflux RND transporter permease subunit [Verrucomicrobiae bacterium]|jgi:HAE1 family hydrophobic/amphiphilic exporter-1|nr:efflux RND transporter permease subunit [Verrucomicrobiae bacterium]
MEPDRPDSNFTTDRPVAVLMVFTAAVVFGYFSLGQLPVTLMPEMSYPTLTIRTEYAGAAPEEVENDISRPIEERLGVVTGLSEISSISRAGVSDVVLEFNWGTPMHDAIQNTLEKLDTVYLPRQAGKPLLLHYDPSLDPVMELSLSESPASAAEIGANEDSRRASARRLRRIAELQVKRAIEPIPGVAAARVRGGLEEEIHVLIDSAKLDRANIPINRVLDRLRAENINAAGGRIREGDAEYMIRAINEYANIEEVANTIITRNEGRELRLKDLGAIVYGQRDREMLTHTDGTESVQIDIYKEADSNMVKVGEAIKAAVGSLRTPKQSIAGRLLKEEGVILKIVADRSIFIDNSIREVRSTAITGGLLAIGILLVFLRDLRTTAIIALSIPISIFVTFAPLHLLDVSLNIMSLGGLAMGIGMLVDSSIVVLESIYRCREEGDPVRSAAIRGTREVRGAVIASTLTSICVFFPMVFVEGLAGQVFSDLGLTVVTSLLASLIVAILFIPMLASRTGFKLKGAAGMVAHPVGGFAGRIRLTTFLCRILMPLAILLAVVVAGHLGYAWWMESRIEIPKPENKVDYKSLGIEWLRFWVPIFVLPLLVSLLKIRFGEREFVGNSLSEVWGSFRDFAGTLRGNKFLLVLMSPYLLLRLPLSFLLEVIGLNLVWMVRLVAGVFRLLFWCGGVVRRFFAREAPSDPETERGIYPKILRLALKMPVVMVLLAIGCFVLTYTVGKELQSELLPEVRQSEFTFEVALPVGTPLDVTVRTLGEIERRILARKKELDIDTLLVMYGFDTANMKGSDEGEHAGKFKFVLHKTENPRATEDRVIRQVRAMYENVPDLNIRLTRPVLFSSKKPIVIQINGEDLPELKRFSDQATELLIKSPELADVEPSLRSGAPEVQIHYDRQQIVRHGLNIQQVANQVRDLVKGNEATRLNRRDRRVPIVVRLAEPDREQVADIGKLTINPGAPTPLPLNAIATMNVGEGPSEIRRIDGKRVALVQANVGGNSLGAAVEAARKSLAGAIHWPAHMDFHITGQNEEWERSRGSLFLALGLSMFLVYVIMASQFESLIQPLIIMFTIPMAFVGTVLGLKWLGINLSVVVFLGMIMLAGIVVNNAIVLVDYANTLRARGLELKEAVVRACHVRLRPILMTTATTVLGLLPMAMGVGDGAEIRTPMAVAVISGLITSTVLTLFIIPTIYYLFGLAGEKFVESTNDEEPAATPTKELA